MEHLLVKHVEKRVKAGKFIFREGDFGDNMFIIKKGEVEIFKIIDDNKLVLDVMHEGEFFGEMSLYPESERTASAVAIMDCTLIVITKRMLDMQLDRLPKWFVIMFKSLISRLRRTDALLKEKVENKKETKVESPRDKDVKEFDIG